MNFLAVFLVCISFISSLVATDIVCIGSSIVGYTIFASDDWLNHIHVEKGGVKTVSSDVFQTTLQNRRQLFPSSSLIVKPGGSAGLVAKGMSHLGLDVGFLSRSGNDEDGHIFRSVMSAHGIHMYGHILPGKTARAFCFISSDAQRSFLFCSGDHGVLSTEDIDVDAISHTKMVHIEGYTIRDKNFLEALLTTARKHHIKVSFDLGSFVLVRENRQFIQDVVFPNVDILMGNSDEMKALFGNEASIDRELKNKPFLSLMLQGPDGCKVYWKGKVSQYPTKKINPVDTTGAGDLFASGFLFGLIKGWPLDQCAALANKLGRVVITNYCGEIPDEQWEPIYNEFSLRNKR